MAEDLQELIVNLPSEKNLDGTNSLYLFKGVWVSAYVLRAVDSFQRHFIAQDTDIIVASMPKSGTTWLKALTFSVAKRHLYDRSESPLLTTPPHELVPFFETDLYMKDPHPNLEQLPPPRIFGCHSHFANLPESIRNSKCKVVYICRNPLDQVVSFFQFAHQFKHDGTPLLSLDECYENISINKCVEMSYFHSPLSFLSSIATLLLLFPSNMFNQKPSMAEDLQELIVNLPREKNLDGTNSLYLFKGAWVSAYVLRAVDSFQRHFNAQDTDIIVASMPKSGTTWLKALTFSVAKRHLYDTRESPLLTTPPHELVPFFETDLYMKDPHPNLEQLPPPRIFGCHSHFANLPESIRNSKCKVVYICRNPLDQVVSFFQSGCKIVYICRNPLDQLVSYFHFARKFQRENVKPLSSIDEGFDNVCLGIQSYGPFWDSVLGYWKASLERPDKVLFLKYEDLKEDITFSLKKLAEFLGLPFSEKEEKEGIIEEISKLCSFDNLRNLEVNRTGFFESAGAPNSTFFRKAKVGDWCNDVSPSMAECFLKIVEEKLAGSGLSFKVSE
ncbi:cytosolic sulfotransferase 15 [Populus alba x Populus x berolinensis]|nr:cytosolic sulfotransferase 15 [Populus alba x Populus x berolinensis]